jgi:hypothetical protein
MRPSIFALCALLAAPGLAEECVKTRYGAGVTLAESTPIATLVEHAADYAGKTVRVEGTVADVCAKAGCWLEIRASEGEQTLRVKVKDGEIVFPTAARGRRVTAEGTFEAKELDREAYVRWAKHVAEEQGRAFDEASIAGAGPFPFYQIAGRGAEICQ